MNFTHDFRADLASINWFSGQPFALVRFADGERAILERREIKAVDGWTKPTESFAMALEQALSYDTKNFKSGCYHVGISCPCCDEESHRFYLDKFRPEEHRRLTFSNLFANGNWNEFTRRVTQAPWHSIGWVGPRPTQGGFPGQLYPVAWVPKNLVNDRRWSDKVNRIVDKMLYESSEGPIFVAAGPAAKIIIHRFWSNFQYDCDRPCVIDVGSSFDPIFHRQASRSYHGQFHANREKVCVWSQST